MDNIVSRIGLLLALFSVGDAVCSVSSEGMCIVVSAGTVVVSAVLASLLFDCCVCNLGVLPGGGRGCVLMIMSTYGWPTKWLFSLQEQEGNKYGKCYISLSLFSMASV